MYVQTRLGKPEEILNLGSRWELFAWSGGFSGALPVALVSPAAAIAIAGVASVVGLIVYARRSPFSPLRAPRGSRLMGVIEPNPRAFRAVGDPRPVVYVRTIFAEPDVEGAALPDEMRETVRGVPCSLRLSDGQVVALAPAAIGFEEEPLRGLRGLTLEDRRALGAPTFGPPWEVRQAALHPGDTVELVGRLERVVDPRGSAAPGRGVPMAVELEPLAGFRIPLRRRRRGTGGSGDVRTPSWSDPPP